MPLTKPNQQLRRDLKEAAALLKWSGVDLMKMAVRLSEAGFGGGLIKSIIYGRSAWSINALNKIQPVPFAEIISALGVAHG